MRKYSKKRQEQLKLYKEAKKELFLYDLKQGKLRCFFSNKPMRIPEELKGESNDVLVNLIECHHIYGERENENLFDKKVMKPVLRYYHTKYHSMSIYKLMEEEWFKGYMNRIEKSHPELWKKEQEKLLK